MKKSVLVRGVLSLEGDNLVVFYYLSASEICPDKGAAIGESGIIRGGLLYFQTIQEFQIVNWKQSRK